MKAGSNKTNNLDFMRMLRRQKAELPVFIIVETESLCEEAKAAGANGCFVLPGNEERLLEAIWSIMKKENAL